MNTKVCIKADGDPKRGRLIIAYLESLGGNEGDYFTHNDYCLPEGWYYQIEAEIGCIYGKITKPEGYTLIDLPTVIGYKAPFDLWEGVVREGTIYIKDNSHSCNHYVPYETEIFTSSLMNCSLPPEIVESWQPVFEQSKFSNEKPVGVRVDSFRALAEWVINHRNSVFREADISDEHKKAICHELNISTNIYKS